MNEAFDSRDQPVEADGLELPPCEQLWAGVRAFETNEPRAGIYLEAVRQVSDNWGVATEMAAGVKRLLDVWHHAFYRFGNFELPLLRSCIERNTKALGMFRNRSISTLARTDHNEVDKVFEEFLDALRGGRRRTPVGVAKALHVLAPEFFPLWDTDIALAYGSWWVYSEFGFLEYLPFCWKMKRLAEHVTVSGCVRDLTPERSVLKVVDEYNYSRFTKKWV